MGLFESHHSYLGVDIGSSGIKLVELGDDKGRARLVTYGYTERSADIVRVDSKENREMVIELLKLLLKKSQVTSKKVVGALPSYAVFSSIIDLPAMPHKELAEAVQWEAKKFVPMPIEEMILDWRELGAMVTRLKDTAFDLLAQKRSGLLRGHLKNRQPALAAGDAGEEFVIRHGEIERKSSPGEKRNKSIDHRRSKSASRAND